MDHLENKGRCEDNAIVGLIGTDYEATKCTDVGQYKIQ
jgi:hypothetical protein